MKTVDFSNKVYVVQPELIETLPFERYKWWIRESTWKKEIDYFLLGAEHLWEYREWKEITCEDKEYPPYEIKKDENGKYSVWGLVYHTRWKEVVERHCLANDIPNEEEAERIKDLYYFKDRGSCCSTNLSTLGDTFETREEAVADIVDFIDVDEINEMLGTDYDEVNTDIVEQYLAYVDSNK